jgi:hypothetical protein
LENGMKLLFERILDGFESTIEIAFVDFRGDGRIATLKPRKNNVWSFAGDSSGLRVGPDFANEVAVSHSHVHDPPAEPNCAALSFKERLRSSDRFSHAATLHLLDLSTPVIRYKSPVATIHPRRPFTKAYQL